jgi:glycosyltransferase involved in cell wall biosynthesis
MNATINKIIFYGSTGSRMKSHESGGAEAGSKKTLEILKKHGYQIILIEKPSRKSFSFVGGILHLFNLLLAWFELIFTFIKHRDSFFHISGNYRSLIYYEWLLVKTARLFNIKAIYEIRNGGMIQSYETGSDSYKKYLKSVFLNSDVILCQGFEYVTFLKEKFNKEGVYYPNYIMDSFISSNDTGRENAEIIKLIYVGRVVPDKNIEFIIHVCKGLSLLNIPCKFDIIGAYQDSYYQMLSDLIATSGLKDNVTFHGRMNFDQIYIYLKQAHFFVFPSKEKREGHSNALTEAMGCGVVPVVSKAGFNESIVGIQQLVMDDYDPQLYVNTIAGIWETKSWLNLSNEVYTRIINNYTESIVKLSLLGAYKSIQ